jgi:cyclophilin family peptidyl-prolyl cis-trans isomerase
VHPVIKLALVVVPIAVRALGWWLRPQKKDFGDGTCPIIEPPAMPAGESRLVTVATDLGSFVVRVDGYLSPIATGNFVALVSCRFYDGLEFHRAVSLQDGTPYVLQGGDPTGSGTGGPGYTIQDEPVTTAYRRGTVALARMPAPNSQGSQFFIVLDDGFGAHLASENNGAIIGKVVSGMDVVDTIHRASTRINLRADAIIMNSVRVAPV